MRPVVDALVAEGLVRRVAVDDGGAPVVVPADARSTARRRAACCSARSTTCVWDRAVRRARLRLRHVIEVYKPEPQRVYGYYVLPFLYGDRLVGRADLKSDRAEGVLRVRAFHLEPRVRRSGALETALRQGARPARPRARARDRRAVIEVSREEAPADRGPRAAARRLGDRRPRDRPPPRLPPDRPDLDGRAAAAPRPLEPARPTLRPRRARPPALGGAEARRVGRVHLPDRGPAAADRAHAPRREPNARELRIDRVPRRRTPRSAATCSASSSGAGRCSRARSRTTPAEARGAPLVGRAEDGADAR